MKTQDEIIAIIDKKVLHFQKCTAKATIEGEDEMQSMSLGAEVALQELRKEIQSER